MKCSSCGGNLKKDAYYCDNCGALVADGVSSTKKVHEIGTPLSASNNGAKNGLIAIAVLALFIALMVGITNSNAATNSAVTSASSTPSTSSAKASPSATPTPTSTYSIEDKAMIAYGEKINRRFGLTVTSAEWLKIWPLNCGVLNGTKAGTPASSRSFYLPDAITKLKASNSSEYSAAFGYTVAASALSGCVSKASLWNDGTWFDYQNAVYLLGTSSSTTTVPGSGSVSGGSTGGGYYVPCSDGTISKSGGKQGACSWHGGLG